MTKKVIKMSQIAIAPWEGTNGLTYSTLALGKDGVVYRYDAACEGWVAYHMEPAKCGLHGHKR